MNVTVIVQAWLLFNAAVVTSMLIYVLIKGAKEIHND